MKVSILTIRGGRQVLAGVLQLVGTRIMVTAEPGFDVLMETVAGAQVLVNDEVVTADQPRLWLANLPKLYTGTMTRAQLS